jgi:MFS family permease
MVVDYGANNASSIWNLAQLNLAFLSIAIFKTTSCKLSVEVGSAMQSFDISKYSQILRVASFRNFFLGFLFSNLGDAMSKVALAWYVWEETQSAAALGLLTLLSLGPVVIGGFFAGWILDRYDKRLVIMVDSIFRGLAVSLVPILFFFGRLEVWHVYVVAALYGFLGMIAWAGGPAIVPTLVKKEQLPTANALESFAFMSGNVLGPSLAGLLISRIGAPNVVALDALTFFLFAGFLVFVRVPKDGDDAQSTAVRQESTYRNAFRLLGSNRILSSTTAMYFVTNIGSGLLLVWLPIYSDLTLQGGAQLYGLLLAAMSAGEVISSFIAGGMNYRVSLGRLIGSALIVGGIPLALLQISTAPLWAALCLFVHGFLVGPLTIWAQTMRMVIIPPELRGRVFAMLRTMMVAGFPVGGALAGALTSAIGIPGLIWLTAGLMTTTGLAGISVKQLRNSDDYLEG